jgi:uncharacterized iron-regulated membrane protein
VSRAGELIWAREAGGGTAYTRVMDPLYGLHFATWARFPAKVLYALLAFLCAFGILAGNLLWLERRRAKAPNRFDAVLARLTSGVCAGLALAVACLFVANQLLPGGLQDRPRWEHGVFLASWAAGVVGAFLGVAPAVHARRLLLVSSGLLFAVPLLDSALTLRLPFGSGSNHVLATEVGLVSLALLLAGGAVAIRRLQRVSVPSSSPDAPDVPEPLPG